MNFLKQENNMKDQSYQELIQENNQLKELLMNYQNTNRKQDLELKLMIEQYNKMESSLEKALEKVLDLEESIPLMIKDMKESQSDWLKKANENLNQEMNNNKEALIKSNEKLMTEASTLLTNISNLETKIKDNTKVLDNANNIVTNFNTESKNVLENIRDKYRENFWKNLLKVGGISFILNGVIIGFFLWVTNLNYNKKLIVRESKIYEKLMQIDRVQRGEAKFYFDKKDNALYIQDAEKRNVPKKLEDETTYLIGFWQTVWNNLFK